MSTSTGARGRFDSRMLRSPLQVGVSDGNPLHFERLAKVSAAVRDNTAAIGSTLLRVSVDP